MNHTNEHKYIYSVNTLKNVLAFSKSLSLFLKGNYPEIRLVSDITPESVQDFIDSSIGNWTKKTAIKNRSCLNKLQAILNNVYGLELNFSKIKFENTKEGPVKDKAMEEEDFVQLVEKMRHSTSKARFIPELVNSIGARTEEIVNVKPENIDLNRRIVQLRVCKNGRDRDVPIRDEFVDLWTEVKDFIVKNNWKTVCDGLTLDSVKRVYRRNLKRIGVSEEYPHKINHAIRKKYAVRRFNEELENGHSEDRAWSIVQQELGHGKRCRAELFRAYIGGTLNEKQRDRA